MGVREITNEEVQCLLHIVRRDSGSVVRWRRAQMEVSNDPDFEAKKNRVLELYAIGDGRAEPGHADPSVILHVDELGPLNLQPCPGRRLAPVATKAGMPCDANWLNRIEAQVTARRYFALDGTDHERHEPQARMIRRHIAWRNRHARDMELRGVFRRASVA